MNQDFKNGRPIFPSKSIKVFPAGSDKESMNAKTTGGNEMESEIKNGQIYEFFTCFRQDGKQWQVISVGFNVVRLVSRKTGIQTNLDPSSLLACKRIW